MNSNNLKNIINNDLFELDLDKNLVGKRIDTIILDPPYGIGSSKLSHKDKNWNKSSETWDTFKDENEQYQFYVKLLNKIVPYLSENGNLLVFGSFHNIYMIGQIIQCELNLDIRNSIVWYKNNAMFNVTRSSLIESTEHIIWAGTSKSYFDYEKSKHYAFGKQLRNVWESPITSSAERVGHPHQKPVWLIQRLLSIFCPKNGFVFDPMCGSGTTGIACELLSLDYLLVERDQEFYNLAVERVKNHKNENSDLFCENDKFVADKEMTTSPTIFD
jgi:site-specific DNA-methyltransferase (adenine-specific)